MKNERQIGGRRKIPSYMRIAADIRTKVASGKIAPGIMLPGRRDLAVEYGVSVPTIDRAVADLLAEGTLRTNFRRGTFVGAAALVEPTTALDQDDSPVEEAGRTQPQSPAETAGEAGRSVSPPVPRSTMVRTALRVCVSNALIGIAARLPLAASESELMSHYTHTIISAVERATTLSGGRSHFRNMSMSSGAGLSPAEGYEALVREGVDVVLLVNAFRSHHFPSLIRAVETCRTPLIVVNADNVSPPLFSVYYDHADAAYQAAKHLFDEGCSELIFFSARSASWVEARWEGAMKAARDAELGEAAVMDRIDRSVIEVENTGYGVFQGGYESARRILQTEGPTLIDGRRGIIAANDEMAIGFIKAAAELGFVIRRDYVIIGFDDRPESRQLNLSTMRPPLEEIGREAVRLALQVVEEAPSSRRMCLHSQLVARLSSRFDSASRV